MNCREFLAEFEERRNALSEWATLHLNDCPDCKKTSGEQTRVWQMIDGLKRIDAPKTFDFRVKARIADSKSTDFQPHLFPVLRYVLPIGVIVLLLGLIAFNSNYFSNGDASPQVAATDVQTPIEREVAPVNSFSSNQTIVANPDETLSVSNPPNETSDGNQKVELTENKSLPQSRVTAPKKNVKEEDGDSRVLSLSKPRVEFPVGLNPNKKIEPSPNSINATPATDEQMWSFFGIKTVSENGRRKVETVEQNSRAERSNVKVGDVIEAIDGEKLSAEPLRTKTFGFKTLTILRGTERIEITLQK